MGRRKDAVMSRVTRGSRSVSVASLGAGVPKIRTGTKVRVQKILWLAEGESPRCGRRLGFPEEHGGWGGSRAEPGTQGLDTQFTDGKAAPGGWGLSGVVVGRFQGCGRAWTVAFMGTVDSLFLQPIWHCPAPGPLHKPFPLPDSPSPRPYPPSPSSRGSTSERPS